MSGFRRCNDKSCEVCNQLAEHDEDGIGEQEDWKDQDDAQRARDMQPTERPY